MPKVNIRESDPAHYAAVQAEQEALKKQYATKMKIAKLCPYCHHKVPVLYQGGHAPEQTKCTNCGEDVIFPPISFRRIMKE